MKFSSLEIKEAMLKGIDEAGFERCTPVQEQSLPEALAGKDIIAQSQTGTGKTAVFVTTVYNRLLSEAAAEAAEGAPAGGKKLGPRALALAPTRELAVQLDAEAKRLGKYTPFNSVAIYGGVEYEKQLKALKDGVEFVVATPGRFIDLYKSRALTLKDVEIFIIDEADRMFDMGFAPDVRYIADKLPRGKNRQTMLFSATIDSNVRRLATRYMQEDYVQIEIEPEQITVDKIDQKVLYPSNEEKLPTLMALLKRPELERAIVFTNMKRTAEELEFKLLGNGITAKALTGDVTQARRQRIIDSMKAGNLKILVATDVVARGLHIEDVSHVINYDLPEDAASYVHRIGRTARAGKSGCAYSLVCEDHALNLPEIERFIERKIEVEWIDEADLVEDKAGRYRRRRVEVGAGRGAVKGRARPGSKGGPGRGSGRGPGRGPSRGPEKREGRAAKTTTDATSRVEGPRQDKSSEAGPLEGGKEGREGPGEVKKETEDRPGGDKSTGRRRRGRRRGVQRGARAKEAQAKPGGPSGTEAAATGAAEKTGPGEAASGERKIGRRPHKTRQPRKEERVAGSKKKSGDDFKGARPEGRGKAGRSARAETGAGAGTGAKPRRGKPRVSGEGVAKGPGPRPAKTRGHAAGRRLRGEADTIGPGPTGATGKGPAKKTGVIARFMKSFLRKS